MKNARPQNSRTSAKKNPNDMPPRLTGQAVLMPAWQWLDKLPYDDMRHKYKAPVGKRRLILMWPDFSICSVVCHHRTPEILLLMTLDLEAQYERARKMLESDWRRGTLC
jgi:hypothetical protein